MSVIKNEKLVGRVIDMGYHRNGVSGSGFWTIIFEGKLENRGRKFTAVYFENENNREILTAVLAVDSLVDGNANLCWRGDAFHRELKKLVENYEWPHEKRERAEKEKNSPNRRGAIAHTKSLES
jgi:hypothetical protein